MVFSTSHALLLISAWQMAFSPLVLASIYPREDVAPITFSDGTCNDVRKDVINLAFKSAVGMAQGSSDVDYQADPGLELFGPQAIKDIGTVDILSVFSHISRAGAWNINASCQTSSSPAFDQDCTDPYLFGGIRSKSKGTYPTSEKASRRAEETWSVNMLFCKDFFRMPSFEAQVNRAIDSLVSIAHDFQGTTLLRELLQYVPKQALLPAEITDLWVLLPTNAEITSLDWFGCYGVACAKTLARVNDPNHWSVRNADNYALYVLAVRLNTTIKNDVRSYPWFPLTTSYILEEQQGSGKFYVHQANYNSSNLGYIKNYNQEGGLDVESLATNRKADLSNASFTRFATNDYPEGWTEARDSATLEIQNHISESVFNWDLDIRHLCNEQGQNAPFTTQNTVPFNRTDAMGAVNTFCTGLVSNERLAPYITVGTTNQTSPDGKLKRAVIRNRYSIPNSNWLNIGVQLNNTRGITTFLPPERAHIFEGETPEVRVRNCYNTFEQNLVRCDGHTDVEKARGGATILRNFKFDIMASPDPSDRLYRDTGKLVCQTTGATTLWLAEEHAMDPEKTCACWFENFPGAVDLYCRPADAECSAINVLPGFNATESIAANTPC
ncbi:hypothetical protein K505DRAFT_358472 [Melanomma pulvis-pyrius CBS 109.77]|uniref:Uncharacterized protein n=1 Tax=Melanomma pulvis-pyrius CBS 109.77 TaxID=1314802 RepID=A0A6A6XP60_9PLEO|nr:hypothetical protein K505DRAFT_358472 [Melanomma pulvis-pyrius CBS 109.77]